MDREIPPLQVGLECRSGRDQLLLHPQGMVTFPRLPEFQEGLDSTLRDRVGFGMSAGPGIGFDDPCGSIPTQDIPWLRTSAGDSPRCHQNQGRILDGSSELGRSRSSWKSLDPSAPHPALGRSRVRSHQGCAGTTFVLSWSATSPHLGTEGPPASPIPLFPSLAQTQLEFLHVLQLSLWNCLD